MDCLAPPGSLDDFISCHGQGQGTPHQSLQLKGDGVTINKKYLISTKKQQDRGKKNEWFGFGAKCVKGLRSDLCLAYNSHEVLNLGSCKSHDSYRRHVFFS